MAEMREVTRPNQHARILLVPLLGREKHHGYVGEEGREVNEVSDEA
jgi:hypothetical protein